MARGTLWGMYGACLVFAGCGGRVELSAVNGGAPGRATNGDGSAGRGLDAQGGAVSAAGGPTLGGSGAGSGSSAGGAGGAGGAAVSNERCEPGSLVCDGAQVMRCTPAGKGYVLEQACDAQQACDSGACIYMSCTPSELRCKDNALVRCSATGLAESLVEQCKLYEELCDAPTATCKPLLCSPGRAYCQTNDRFQCSEDGTARTLLQHCGDSDQYCVDNTSDAYSSCVPRTCQPGAALCVGAVATVCKPGGSISITEGRNCDYPQQRCVQGQCVP